MTPEENIEHALFARVRDTLTQLPIAWPNVEFEPPQDHKYVAVMHFRNLNDRLYLSGNEQHRRGLLQLSVVHPLEHGSSDSVTFAGNMILNWPQDLVLSSENVRVRVTKQPDCMSPIKTDVSWIVPVSVYYEAFV